MWCQLGGQGGKNRASLFRAYSIRFELTRSPEGAISRSALLEASCRLSGRRCCPTCTDAASVGARPGLDVAAMRPSRPGAAGLYGTAPSLCTLPYGCDRRRRRNLPLPAATGEAARAGGARDDACDDAPRDDAHQGAPVPRFVRGAPERPPRELGGRRRRRRGPLAREQPAGHGNGAGGRRRACRARLEALPSRLLREPDVAQDPRVSRGGRHGQAAVRLPVRFSMRLAPAPQEVGTVPLPPPSTVTETTTVLVQFNIPTYPPSIVLNPRLHPYLPTYLLDTVHRYGDDLNKICAAAELADGTEFLVQVCTTYYLLLTTTY